MENYNGIITIKRLFNKYDDVLPKHWRGYTYDIIIYQFNEYRSIYDYVRYIDELTNGRYANVYIGNDEYAHVTEPKELYYWLEYLKQ